MQRTLLTAILFLSACTAFCQPSAHPADWILDTTLSDEFNSGSLDTTKWWYWSPCFYSDSLIHGFVGGNGAFFRPENVFFEDGNIVFKVDYNPDSSNLEYPCHHSFPYPFYSGGIESVMTNSRGNIGYAGRYWYGYYEMRAKLPGYYDSLNNPVGVGFNPVFWFYYQHVVNHCNVHHDEVDILEPTLNYYDARTNVVGWHDETDTCTSYKVGEDSMRSSSPLFLDYHTYAVELLPDHIIFYFDDVPFFSASASTSPQIAHSLDFAPYLSVVMVLQMTGGHSPPYPLPGTPFPEYMYVDYFRYYRYDTLTDNLLYQNFPNPFKTNTEIDYHINREVRSAELMIRNVNDIIIQSVEITPRGDGQIFLTEQDLAPGIYFYSLYTDGELKSTKKFVVIK